MAAEFNPFLFSTAPQLGLELFLDAVLDEALRKIGADLGGAVVLRGVEDRPSVFRLHSASGEKLRGRPGELLEPDEERDLDRQLFEESGSALSAPLFPGEPLAGAIRLESSSPRAFRAAQRSELEEIAASAGVVVSRLLFRDHAAERGLRLYLIGRSPRLLRMESEIQCLARDPSSPVLVLGERGSGKELAAYAVHYYSARRNGPFVPVNSAALSDTLFADELFGHERHAFTGAQTARRGLLEAAQGGTLFFDEVGDMAPNIQATLLRVIEQGELHRLGQDRPVKVDVRVVGATNHDLDAMVRAGKFRADLFDRLNVLRLQVPPLRDRREDIELLASYFLKQACVRTGRHHRNGNPQLCGVCLQGPHTAPCAPPDFLRRLVEYDYPGNVRELRNLIARLTAVVPGDRMHPEDVTPHLQHDPAEARTCGDLRLDTAMREHIRQVLAQTGYHKTRTAELLGLPLTTLVHKMKKLGI